MYEMLLCFSAYFWNLSCALTWDIWMQIWNWFQNKRHAQRARSAKMSENLYFSPPSYDDAMVQQASTNSSAALSGLLLCTDLGVYT